MELVKATPAQIDAMEAMFAEAFPPEEMWPFSKMLAMQAEGWAEFLAITDHAHTGDTALGGVILFQYGGKNLWSMFGVGKAYRQQGIGQKIIDLMKETYRETGFFGEVEVPPENAPADDLRVRRRNFYLRNGLQPTGIFLTIDGILLELLTYHCTITPAEYRTFYYATAGEDCTHNVFKLRLVEEP